MSKNYFGVLDSRNTKYQGLIKDNSFQGIGILIDNLSTTIITTWNKYSLNGHSVIIFPYLEILFGQIINDLPTGIVCFQINQTQKLVVNYDKTTFKSSDQILTIAHVVAKQSVIHIQKKMTTSQYSLIQTHYCKNQEEELKILSNTFKKKVSKDNINIKAYLQKNFVQNYQFFELLGKNELFFGFKNSNSLGFKLQNNNPTAIGTFNKFPRNLIFGRKIYYNFTLPGNTKIEEGLFEQPSKVFSFLKQKGSTGQYQKFAQEYFKKSTTFRNQFTKIDHIDKLCLQFKNMLINIKQQTSKKVGQALLQNDYGSAQNNQKQQVVTKQYTLSEVKQQIYKAAAKKQGTYRNSQRSPPRSTIKRHTESYFYVQPSPQLKRSYIDSNRTLNQVSFNGFNEQKYMYLDSQNFRREKSRQKLIDRYYKKPVLIKDVNERLTAERQYEKALINQLIKEDEMNVAVYKNEKERLPRESPQWSQQSAYKKYKRYQRLKSPNITAELSSQKKIFNKSSNKRSSPKRTYNYTQKQQLNGRNTSPYRQKSPYQILRRDKSSSILQRRNKTQTITPFIAEFSEQNRTLTHDHLLKYKQRRREHKGGLQSLKNQKDRYKYLNQNVEEQNSDKVYQLRSKYQVKEPENKQISAQQIKLFGNNNYNNLNYNNLTQKNNYSQNFDNFGEDRAKDKLYSRNKQLDSYRISQRQKRNYDEQSKLQRNHGISPKRLDVLRGGNNKQNWQIGEKKYQQRSITPKKMKRTFNYVD